MALLLLASLSTRFYQLTNPFETSAHIFVLRKAESLLAFTTVGALVGRSWWRSALVVGLFSGLIEVVQHLHGSEETFAQMMFDVLLGIAGGAAGAELRNRLMRLLARA